jgi:hypothetical protein
MVIKTFGQFGFKRENRENVGFRDQEMAIRATDRIVVQGEL